ncbi:MAG: cyanophycinase [Nocardioidaceae bacterium]
MVTGGGKRGILLAIGGAETKVGRASVLAEFVRHCGGAKARIAVVPTASSLGPEIEDVYRAAFTRLKVPEVVVVRPENRAEANSRGVIDQLDGVTGIFLTGGNQLRLSVVITGTRFGDAVKAAHRRGITVAGTSAGASIMSSHMVAFGSGGATPKQRMTQLAAGLALLEGCVIDQHFEQRNRYGRLLSLVAQSPSLLGIGIDEDTAAVIGPDDVLDVVGRGSVTVVDGRSLISNAHEAKHTKPLLVSGAVVHVLPAGSRFDLATRRLCDTPDTLTPFAIEELVETKADLRQLTEDVAAEGVSPTHLQRRLHRRHIESAQ